MRNENRCIERKKERFNFSKRPKWPIRSNMGLHLKEFHYLYRELNTKISLKEIT